MKRLLKFLFRTLITIVGFVLLYLLCAWVFSRITIKAEPGQSSDVIVYLKTNGVHADIVLPVKNEFKDWSTEIPYAHTRSGDSSVSYLAFGWGDKAFYLETPTWADLKFKTAFRAAFALSNTAMHTTYYHALTEDESCVSFAMGAEQYKRLIKFIENGFEKDSSDKPIIIPTEARYGQYDAFYEATGTYSLFQTCNTWTNKALKASGQKACWWTPFDKGIFYQYKKK
jgi:uncharacterized protein (TIGR02117 family)